MRLTKKVRRFMMSGVFAGSMAGMGLAVVGTAPAASATDALPAYTANGFCVNKIVNVGPPTIKGKTCTGQYAVTNETRKFSEDNLKVCPQNGTLVNLGEKWISPPTGGDPTVLASYWVSL